MTFEKLYQNQNVQLLAVAFIAALFIAPPEALLQDDLDSAVRWASSHLFELGSDKLFLYPHTNGPLFFLKFPIPGNHSILLSILFDFTTKLILGYYLLALSKNYRPTNFWLPIAVLMVFCSLFYLDFIIIGIVLGMCLSMFASKKILRLMPGILVLVISIFIKASISFPVLLIFGSTLLIFLFHKEYIFSLKITSITVGCFVLLTWVLYGNLIQSIFWIFSSFIATLSYGSDQAIWFNNSIVLLILSALSILALPLLVRNRQTYALLFISALAIFSIWKYSLGREDFTHYRAWYYSCILMACMVVLINQKKEAIIGFTCFFMSLTFFVTNTKKGDSPKTISYHLPRLDYLPRVIFKPQAINEEFKNQSLSAMCGSILSDSMLKKIGNQSIDIFPWGLAILYKYKLNYQPRPGFHSTILGTMADKKERDYFASADAPEYVLWHESQPMLYTTSPREQVYLPNTVPNAVRSILQHYSMIQYQNGYALWQKRYENKIINIGDTTIVYKMNHWLTLPPMDSNVLAFAHTNINETVMEKIVGFLFTGLFYKIAYKLENGKVAWNFISLESLQHDFLAHPYFINPAMDRVAVKEILIQPMNENDYDKELKITFKKTRFEN